MSEPKIKDCQFRSRQRETVRFERTHYWWMCVKHPFNEASCHFHGNGKMKQCEKAVKKRGEARRVD